MTILDVSILMLAFAIGSWIAAVIALLKNGRKSSEIPQGI